MQRAQRRKYHYIYKTICIITNKFYIGMHSTDNLEDGYIGSGKRLWHSINKYGKDNHIKEILEFLPDRKSLSEREREIVDQEMLNEELCMNLIVGGDSGSGGFSILSKEERASTGKKGANALVKRLKEDPEFAKEYCKNVSLTLKNDYKTGKRERRNVYDWTDKKHTEESKKIMSLRAKERTGNKNSQFGKCWITNEIESKKINKGDMIPEGWRLGRKM
jgi:hypothetical protein